ncbi:MAG: nucleotidyltransferase domain-containing protein [Ktedonobacteraceae bacterium]|nr:nucleotidyltransferase domain-containing protein [Ktedonobacteraceae bacterium]
MQHHSLIQRIVERLKTTPSLKAIVLGGSYAAGRQKPDSDIDLGLYYYERQPLDIDHIRAIAAELNDTSEVTATPLGGWGRWVNGGAWLTIQGQRVDFLYRNIDFVSHILNESTAGKFQSDYWQQPAYGFHSYMYCTETRICQPLYDPEHIISDLKARVTTYPHQLKHAIIKDFLWSARFTLDNTYKLAARGDVYIVTGCIARALHCLVQVVYALNESWYISEKRVAEDVLSFGIQPERFLERTYAILGAVGHSSTQLQGTLQKTEQLYSEMAALSRSASQ